MTDGGRCIRHLLVFIATVLLALELFAQERRTELSTVTILGETPDSLTQALAPKKISSQKIKTYQHTDVHRVFKQTAGVYVREEEGQGLRSNIGMRGTNPDRSKKIVLLEDGVLVSPAPYSAPAAYFAPSMNHVDQIDIMKGFAGMPYGPNSVGGAINYLTPAISYKPENELRFSYGAFSTTNSRITSSAPTPWGGYLVQVSRLQSDGFKHIDGGGDTSFEQNHFLSKVQWRASVRQTVQLTFGLATERSNETYSGLAGVDFAQDPYRRYSSSALDQMKWFQWRSRLSHAIRIGDNSLLETTVYHQNFYRAWYRLDRFNDSSVSMRRVLLNPTDGANNTYFNILSGATDSSALAGGNGQLVYANNDRSYMSQGIQTKLSTSYETGFSKNKSEFGVRLHRDSIFRQHTSDRYNMRGGQIYRTSQNSNLDDLNTDSALALTLNAHEDWDFGQWVVTPVVRYEAVKFTYDNQKAKRIYHKNDQVFVPGLSVLRKLGDKHSLRTSVNRATTVSGINRVSNESREEAINYELEWKYLNPDRSEEAGLTGFFNDYKNLTGTCTASNGCATQQVDMQFSGGKAKIYGLEAYVGKTLRAQSVSFPLNLNVTYMVAQFDSDIYSGSPEWGQGMIHRGDPLPYIPQLQYTATAGTHYGKLSQDLSIVYHDRVFDQSVGDERQELAAWGILDWVGGYQASQNLRITAKADNILDRRYAVAARPFGYRPGKPQSYQVGLAYTF